MSQRSLYAITEELDTILSYLDQEGVTDDEKQAAVDEWLNGQSDEIEKKVDDYCAMIRDREDWAARRKQEAQALASMAAQDERTARFLKERLQGFFERVGIEKMRTLHFAPRVQQNGGELPLMIDPLYEADPSLLPQAYTKVVKVIVRDELRDALEKGASVPGCRLGDRGKHLRLR